MSVNRREEIFEQLFTILGTVTGFETKVRNRALRSNDDLPGIVLMDGDETATKNEPGRGRPGMATSLTVMQPQIFILLKNKLPTNTNAGQELNAFRGEIIRAIAADAQLKALIGPNGAITYDGCETDLKSGGALEGEMQLNFSITSVMNPNA